jgi:hypothetical protein
VKNNASVTGAGRPAWRVWLASADGRLWLAEAFALTNLAFLAVDIWVAHSVNAFAHASEYIPLIWSCVAPLLLLPGLISRAPAQGLARRLGWLVGLISIVVGVLGFLLHLESSFFAHQTLSSLVYTAPFVAPLSYAGIGMIVLLNRTESASQRAWSQWILLLAACGFVGNFLLTVFDHAQNGFFHGSEWLAVLAAAFGLSFILVAVVRPFDRPFVLACAWMMGAQILVGSLGAGLHLVAIMNGPAASLWENVIFTAPIFAPLLFVNLAVLAALGLWGLWLQSPLEPPL